MVEPAASTQEVPSSILAHTTLFHTGWIGVMVSPLCLFAGIDSSGVSPELLPVAGDGS